MLSEYTNKNVKSSKHEFLAAQACLEYKARLRVRVFVMQVFTISKTNALEEGIIRNKHYTLAVIY
jgi:hypothetical protein